MSVSLGRYAGVYLATMIVAAVLIALLRRFANIDLGSSFIPLLPAMTAAMLEGNKLAIAGASAPTGKNGWLLAAQMTAIAVGFNAALGVVVIYALTGGDVPMHTLKLAIGYLALYGALWLVTNRFFLGLGYRNAGVGKPKAGQ